MRDADLLTLTQWLSPVYPVGGFAYSHGLEWAISTGRVHDADSLRLWLDDLLRHGSGRTDAILLALSLRPDADHDALAAMARALAASRERLAETDEMGAAFTRTTNALTGQDQPPAPLPVALGRAARDLDLPRTRVLALYLHSFVSNLVQSAVRFVPLGQTDGQTVLMALHATIGAVAEQAATAGPDGIVSATFGSDLAAMAHETMDVRIFKT